MRAAGSRASLRPPKPDDLGRAAADIEDDDAFRRRIGQRRTAGDGERRFRALVDDLQREFRLSRDAADEVEPVGGGATGFRRDEAGAGDAAIRHLAAAYLQRLDGAVHRGIAKAAARAQAFAQAHDAGEGVDDAKAMLRWPGDQ